MVTHNLPPQLTSFIGRTHELAAITALLDDSACRLLTLVGPGGMGKTRLAIEVARERQENFPDGVWFVSLAPLTASDQILTAMIQALDIPIGGQPSLEEILKFLKNKQLLLVLDNFEHLLDGVGLIESILIAAPGVKILVTSRTTLNMQAEWVHSVQGLRYPDSDTSDHWDEFSAVKLFVERAQRVRPDFSLNQSGSCVVRICQLVDGMPLAIELAAAWLKTLRCDSIPDYIQRGLDFLASNQRDLPERQRSIRAVFDHSWNLLTPQEQQAFPRFSVFHGGCTLQAAEQVAGASLSMIASLVEKSLLTLEPSGRYGLHELLRQYGEEKLITSGELEAIRDVHTAYYCHFMGQSESDIKGGRQVEALNDLEADIENIRVAWLRAADQRNFTAIDVALEGLYFLFSVGTRLEDLAVLFDYADQRLVPLGAEPPQRAWRRVLGRPNDSVSQEQAVRRCEQALALARQYGDEIELGIALHWLGEVVNRMRASQAAITYLEEGLQLLRAQGERYYVGRTLNELGRCYLFMGQPREAIPYSQEALNLRRETNDRIGMAWCLWDLGEAYTLLGEMDEATRCWIEACHYFSEVRSFFGLNAIHRALIAGSLWGGNLEEAQRWEAAYLEVCTAYHVDPTPDVRVHLALVAALAGDAERCRSLCQVGLEVEPIATFLTQLALAIGAAGIADLDAARLHFLEMLNHYDLPAVYYPPLPLAYLLPIAAILLTNESERVWAVELLALAFGNPPYLIGWMKRWSVITDLLENLENKLGADVFSAAWERGEGSNLDPMMTRLISRFSADPDVRQQANQSLKEPLSLRELEVLNLIAAGASNQEIAERLVIGMSTVKKHINHVFAKLGVESRTQALVRARALNLF